MNRRIKQGAFVAAVVAGLGALGAGCLSRPVETQPPNLKTNFTIAINTTAITKIDLLFDIDNSASMGDKQQYLQTAIPDLINRLINPNCIDPTTMVPAGASTNGVCTMFAGTQVEFPPVHDMHIGIVSSSLGSRLGDQCVPTTMAQAPFSNLLANDDDQAHLLTRSLTYAADLSTATQGTVADASQGFLYWYPATMANSAPPVGAATPITSAMTLQTDFTSLVGGVGVFGCGIESQLESWYRFLVQPDPYDSLTLTNGLASWSGVDQTILQQRADFLRPDSLVTIIVLSDENDSEIDVRSLGQQGYHWMSTMFAPPRGTSACGNDGVGGNPGDPNCVSCAESGTGGDANCMMTGGDYQPSGLNDWGYDLNLRHVHTKAKYGIDPQFPIQRYQIGLSNPTVPDRDHEYPVTNGKTSSGYVLGNNNCTNPLFAGKLPTGGTTSGAICNLPPGTRTKDLIFYAHIGGVPSSLLHFTPNNAAASTLTDADWVKILGNNPIPPNYDYGGIDPHMLESFTPRSGGSIAPPGSANNADPISGHEWVTNSGAGHILNVDREYACTFPLYDTMGNPTTRDCTLMQNQNFCDCPHMAGTVTADQLPPICNQTTITQQVGAKAYPTIRELELAHLMGTQGIVSSICPIDGKDNAAGDDPLYGYRPAVSVIIDRLSAALTNQCLPEQLDPVNGVVPCLILVQLPATSGGGTCKNPNCDNTKGLFGPGQTIAGAGATGTKLDQSVLDSFCDAQEIPYQQQVQAAGSSTGLTDPATQPVCAFFQLTQAANPNAFSGDSCSASQQPGWCYVTGAAAKTCPQAIIFADQPNNGTINLQCLEQSASVLDSSVSSATANTSGSNSSSGASTSSSSSSSSGVTTGGE